MRCQVFLFHLSLDDHEERFYVSQVTREGSIIFFWFMRWASLFYCSSVITSVKYLAIIGHLEVM